MTRKTLDARLDALTKRMQPKPDPWLLVIELPDGRYRDDAGGQVYTEAELDGRRTVRVMIPDNGRGDR